MIHTKEKNTKDRLLLVSIVLMLTYGKLEISPIEKVHRKEAIIINDGAPYHKVKFEKRKRENMFFHNRMSGPTCLILGP